MTVSLRLENISKSFPGVRALADVSFSLSSGEIRALVGENGAGKSTLIKILSGAYSADTGRIELFGHEISRPTPSVMIKHGVAVIYQELAQAPHLSVAENILMGRLPRKGGLIDWAAANRLSNAVIEKLGFDLKPNATVGELSVAKRQMVEIAKALARKARIIVLDEPSAVLAQTEIDQLFRIIRQLAQDEGVSFIYISHRLREVFEISHTVTIMRDGMVVHEGPSSEMTTELLIKGMVGREITDIFPQRTATLGDEALAVTGLSTESLLKNVSIKVRRGEIVGLFGLAGAGRTELLRAIYGADSITSGEIRIKGVPGAAGSPRRSLARGVGLVAEDRRTEGLFLTQSVGFNIMSASLARVLKFGLLSRRLEKEIVHGLIGRLRIKTPRAETAVQSLSGGNQQKCVIARLVSAGCEIMLADEPTRGVDVAAKREIYDLLLELAMSRGLAIVMASSELPEILGLCDRVYVMREGEVSAEFDARAATEEEIMHFAALH